MKVRLTRKLADALNGLDLRGVSVGQEVDLSEPLGRMLIAEHWAVEVGPGDVRGSGVAGERAVARAKP